MNCHTCIHTNDPNAGEVGTQCWNCIETYLECGSPDCYEPADEAIAAATMKDVCCGGYE